MYRFPLYTNLSADIAGRDKAELLIEPSAIYIPGKSVTTILPYDDSSHGAAKINYITMMKGEMANYMMREGCLSITKPIKKIVKLYEGYKNI